MLVRFWLGWQTLEQLTTSSERRRCRANDYFRFLEANT